MIKFSWEEYPIGFPLEEDDEFGNMAGDRSPPVCSLSIDFTYGSIHLRQAVRKDKLRKELTQAEIDEMSRLLLNWLQEIMGFTLDHPYEGL